LVSIKELYYDARPTKSQGLVKSTHFELFTMYFSSLFFFFISPMSKYSP